MKEASHGRVAAIVIGFLVVIIAVGALANGSCSKGDPALEEGMSPWADAQTLDDWTQTALDELNSRDYGAVAASYADGDVSAESLESQFEEPLDELGAFQEVTDSMYLHGQSNARPYTCVVWDLAYENGAAQIRASFFEDGSLAALLFMS